MDNECTHCHDKFEDGQNVMAYKYGSGELYFCGNLCRFTEKCCAERDNCKKKVKV